MIVPTNFSLFRLPDLRPTIAPDISGEYDEYVILMKQCWNHTPRMRPSFQDVIMHPFFHRGVVQKEDRIDLAEHLKAKTSETTERQKRGFSLAHSLLE